MRRFAGLLVFALATIPACSADPGEDLSAADGGGEVLPFEFVQPFLERVAPDSMALGDNIQVFGGDFLPSEFGTTVLRLSGRYTDDSGAGHNYEGEIPLDVKNLSVASFVFEDLVFIPGKDRIGVFSGEATIVSELHPEFRSEGEESTRSSEPTSVSLTVKPSIGIVQLRSVSEPGCAPITKGTIGDQELGLSVDAIGVDAATVDNPITFRVRFQSPDLKVVFAKDQGYAVWPSSEFYDIGPDLSPEFAALAGPGEHSFDITITEGNRLVLDPTWRKDKVRVSPPVVMGQFSYDEVLLGRFATGPTNGQSNAANIFVEATLGDGTRISRNISYKIAEAWEVQNYNQNVALMERSNPIPVSGCFSGGDVGRDLTYTEGTSVTQSRSLSFRWDRNVANTLGVSGGLGGLLPVQLTVNASSTFSETFGVDINETVSSESHVGVNFSARIIPGYKGICYRQIDRLKREVDVVYTNACGVTGVIGQTILTDWNFGFDIAIGPSCDASSDLDPGGNFEPDGIEYN